MKRVLTVFLILVFSLMALGACSEEEDISQAETDKENSVEIEQESSGEDRVEFEYPPEVEVWLANMRDYFVAGTVDTEEGRFLIVNWGQQPTAGYEVSIVDIREHKEELQVKVKFQKPEEMAAQVITYPYTVKKVSETEQRVNFIPQTVESYIPQVVGSQPTQSFAAASENIKIMDWEYKDQDLYLQGLARVFEANLNYEVLTEDAQVVDEGFVTAWTAGPDWGFFEIELSDIEAEASSISIFSVSMKDGSRENEIEITF
ncbi:protease complex subunit PrcB family protein [Fuchsiella alkaliacetigena]|uniref:protease complex subunit PrcB family protein n=1 Tax=Fuchsiella alkaliacetigena TaxID=957042 RepID=UPI00200B0712|nr:protease complex subunit PrcB family protein [Fuchsiella alkaliacetigena]MCK8825577.1 protease complex subunit PrcB family protein [Fuchsiella alkaliacetigena]